MRAESIGRLVAAVILAAAGILHIVLLRSAGPFWRDEINTIRLACSPTVARFIRDLPFDSAPVLGFALLRGWLTIFDANTLRFAGLLAGAGLLAMLCARGRIPLIAIAIVGTSGAIVRYGDSVRSYGLAMIAAVALYLAAERARWGLAVVAAIAAVQLSFHNAVVVFAVCVAAAIVRKSIVPLLIGATAAVSLIPYVPVLRVSRDFSALTRYEVDALWVWHKLEEAMAMSGPFALRVWIFLLFVALVLSFRARYAGLVLVILTAGYALFLYELAYLMQPWYFVIYLAVAAIAIDDVLTTVVKPAVPVLALLVAAICFPYTLGAVRERSTNMDRVAAAARADLVIVYPWYLGVSFSEYARGQFETMPPLTDHRLHRYDLARAASEDRRSGEALIAQARAVLANGGTVMVAGFAPFEESAAYLQKPERATGIAAADLRWSRMLVSLGRAEVVVPPDPSVSSYERAMLVKIQNPKSKIQNQ